MNKKGIIWAVVIVAAVFLLGRIFLNRGEARGRRPVAVRTAAVTMGDIESYLSVTGTVRSKNTREHYGPQAKIKELHVKVGDSVQKGDLLVSYEVQRAVQNQEELEAEIDGVITQVNVVEGGYGNSMQPQIIIQDLENLKVVSFIGKYDSYHVKAGQRAFVQDANKEYAGEVSFIDPVARKATGAGGTEAALGIEIDIKEKADLIVEFDVDVDILTGAVSGVLKVPAEAVKAEKGNKYIVYVVKDGRAEEREVKLGIQSDMEVEILEGLRRTK